MKEISNINKIIEFNQDGRAYILISTFELWQALYRQILSCKNVRESNRDAWQMDWNIGIEYIKQEFNKRYVNSLGFTVVVMQRYENLLSFSLADISCYTRSVAPMYVLTENYEVDLI